MLAEMAGHGVIRTVFTGLTHKNRVRTSGYSKDGLDRLVIGRQRDNGSVTKGTLQPDLRYHRLPRVATRS